MKKKLPTFLIVAIVIPSILVGYLFKLPENSESSTLERFEYVKLPLVHFKGLRILITDVDKNGQNDILVSGTNRMSGTSEVRLIQIKNFSNSKIFSGRYPGGVLWVDDFNGDGYPDVVSHEVNRSGNYTLLHLLINNGKGIFELQNSYEFVNIDITSLSSILIQDMITLVVGGYRLEDNLMRAIVFELDLQTNDRRKIWEYPNFGNTALLGLTKGDFNGDGLEDIAVIVNNDYGERGEVIILFNGGNGNFRPFNAYINPRYTYRISSGDFNNDGIDDIAINDVNEELHGRVVLLLMKKNNGPEVKEYILNRGSFIDSIHSATDGTLWLGVTKVGRVPVGVLMQLNAYPETFRNIESEFANSLVKYIRVTEKRQVIFLLEDMDKKEDFLIILKGQN